ncbi:hypothetical protein ADIARSV_1654 [Arcticibacter svalbardensis MN12-7]|uniref:SusD/RagB family nutrient-binding outer membrane lipoprotein n=1 Tax=Arcticibacter svalbardensis MN12-7 TaxID=1150600 RepID=R9GTZ9_9SPHI|nr:SusD/RagB family nutrient-binding outer membrane lipoprotein [Arcticibacter svalbardensis]EOR95166.1 hypothetical protein ADIARSV_1654 [Arcticibacter svalbardensis MN12-7]
MKFRYKKYTFLVAGILLLNSSCKKFVDINDDPNNPTVAQLSLLLPSSEISMASNMYLVNSGASTFIQHAIFSSNLGRFQQSGTSFNDSWNGFYSQSLNDIETIISTGTQQEQWGYVAIAKLEKAYLYSIMVDMWGKIPFSESNQGQVYDSPAFEEGAEIYEKVFVLIDEAIADANKVSGTTLLTSGGVDVFYGGTKTSWISMANSLKLKLYNQIRLVDPARSAAAITALVSTPATLIGGTTNANTTDFIFKFGSSISPNNRHPWHRIEYQASKTFYMSQSLISTLFSNDDPRLRYYIFRQNATAGLNNSTNSNGYYGREPGDPTAVPADLSRRATFGIYPAGGLYDNATINNLPATNVFLTNPASPGAVKVVGVNDGSGAGVLPLITNFMVKFIRAEAALTLNTESPAAARQHFIDGVTASLNSIGTISGIAMPATTISGFTAKLAAQYDAANAAEKLNLVMTQKYIASYGNGMESYTDYRRTALPVLRGLASPLNVFPLRMYYSDTELTTNSTIMDNASAIQTAQQITPVFWDK